MPGKIADRRVVNIFCEGFDRIVSAFNGVYRLVDCFDVFYIYQLTMQKLKLKVQEGLIPMY